MAPSRIASRMSISTISNTKRTSSSRGALQPTKNVKETRGKRKANSPPVKETSQKRSALGDVTNKATDNTRSKGLRNILTGKKVSVQQKVLPSVRTAVRVRQNENLAPPPAPAASKVQTRAAARTSVPNETVQKPKETVVKESANVAKVKRLSNEFEKSEESLYSTALEEINVSDSSAARRKSKAESISSKSSTPVDEKPSNVTIVSEQLEQHLHLGTHEVPHDVCDFDKENWDDIFQVSHYAMDIFTYLKTRETLFMPKDYMQRQPCLTTWMRSLLVDWMVEIQESFELNHETLYLGVKLVDLYLSHKFVSKDTLQLVGAAAMFIASKYDERIPPLISDFLYICDGAYGRKQLIEMEIDLLKVCNFNLGIPISYRFLRRYARCAKVSMPILTLARFILEFSLMDYDTIAILDSKLAAASLFLALRMKNVSKWTPTLQFYTGYKLEQIIGVVHILNNGLHAKPKEQLMTVRNKYSHKIFFEVAKTPLVKNEELLE